MNRNEECWCGSGKKYKKCHLPIDEKMEEYRKKGYIVPSRTLLKTPEMIEGMKKSAVVNTKVLDYVAEHIRPGISTQTIDEWVNKVTYENNAIPAPLNYMGYPKSVCTSVNDQVCHGIPSEDVILKEGDIVNVDVSTILNGYFSDASRMFIIGDATDNAKRLVEVAKECLEEGLKAVKPWETLGAVGEAIQKHAEENGYSVVRAFGGHGIGNEFHEDPFVAHVGRKGQGMLMVPGMTFTIEPMINEGVFDCYVDKKNGWEAYTADGGLSAQWEHMILVTETGYEIIAY